MSKLSKLIRTPGAFLRDSWLNPRSASERRARQQRDPSSGNSTALARNYAALLEAKPIAEKTVLYESFHGTTMSCNPLALFKGIRQDPRFADFRHVWVLKDRLSCTVESEMLQGVQFVAPHSAEYLKHLATAQYLINNTSFPPYFQRREGQLYLNTWHGTPWKTLGRDMRGSAGQHKNIQRNLVQSTHLLSQSRYMTDAVLRSHDLHGIYPGKVIQAGYPRVDLTMAAPRELVRRRLDITSDKPVLLIAPTWRGEVGRVTNVSASFLSDIDRLCAALSSRYEIFFRGHVLEQKQLLAVKLPCRVVPDNLDTNELLAAVDGLVTDYSSILFDYLRLGRPLYLYAYDFEAYADQRGLYFPASEIPAELCTSLDRLIAAIQEDDWAARFGEAQVQFCHEYLPVEDGHATERVIEAFLNGDDAWSVSSLDTTKKTLLMYCGGFSNNGVTTSALSLLSQIDYDAYNVILVESGETTPERVRNLSQLPREVRMFFRTGSCNTLRAEAAIISRYYASGKLDEASERRLRDHYHRERRRLFGEVEVDVAIDFSGYVKIWTLMFGMGRFPRRIVYQHNDMMAENDKIVSGKYKHRANFKVIFDAYRFFDKIVAVSQPTRDLNYESLRTFIDESKSSFDYVNNPLAVATIRERASGRRLTIESQEFWWDGVERQQDGSATLRLFPLPNRSAVNFIHIGRFSPEKRHDKLLEAFSRVLKRVSRAHLYLVGDGVLFKEVSRLAQELGLSRHVTFIGHVQNPYALLCQCDCLVLASDHEGQPMVLLEALTLGVPAVATDIVGSRSVLGDRYGLLVPNSVDGLVWGMLEFVEGRVATPDFDPDAYTRASMARFYSVVCGDGKAAPDGGSITGSTPGNSVRGTGHNTSLEAGACPSNRSNAVPAATSPKPQLVSAGVSGSDAGALSTRVGSAPKSEEHP